MKKEILRISSLDYTYAAGRKLENISMCILEGESVGFLGLTYSGKDLLVRLLCGEAEADIRGLNIYVDGARMSDQEELARNVYRIAASNYKIDDWTVAEYIGLVGSGWFQMLWNRRRLEEETDAYFKELGIPFDVSRKLKELTELEKRIADMVKARRHGARIVIVEDEFEGMRPESIGEFACIMKKLARESMAVIVNSHSDMVLSMLSDKYIIMKKGRIVKKCRTDYIQDGRHLEKFLLGSTIKSKKQNMDSYTLEQSEEKKTVYRVRGLRLKDGRKGDFNFSRGRGRHVSCTGRQRKGEALPHAVRKAAGKGHVLRHRFAGICVRRFQRIRPGQSRVCHAYGEQRRSVHPYVGGAEPAAPVARKDIIGRVYRIIWKNLEDAETEYGQRCHDAGHGSRGSGNQRSYQHNA